MTGPSSMRVIIAGAGIAGLTAALSLHAAGITDVTVHEAVEEIQPLGVGINLLPHAVRELMELGLGDRLAETGVATADLTFLNPRGQRIWSEPRGRAAGYRWPQYSIHRGRLLLLLLDAVRERLGPGAVVLGSRITALDHDADLLIGADGILSDVRRAMFPGEGGPVPGGDVLWRGTTYGRPFMTGRSMLMIGDRGQKLVIYPIAPPSEDGTQLINWAVQHRTDVRGVPTGDWNQPIGVSKVLPPRAGLALRRARRVRARRGCRAGARISAGGPGSAAVLVEGERDVTRRRGAPDVPDGLQRRHAGGHRRAGAA
ncbi:FAD-dependent monooxygenase [Nonomuraea salmonea]|uniref:FAD-dependent monooxygenase n=1 Tax=Nonomuraea salmonea TaxID=46181 RepID=UPI0031F126AA